MRRKLIIILLIILLPLTSIFIKIYHTYPNTCDAYSITKVKGEASFVINKLLYNELNKINYNYDNITSITKDNNNNISYIYVNTELLNGIALNLNTKIKSSIESEQYFYEIPIGNLTGTYLLSGRGPKIKIHISPTNATIYKIENELTSSGINQTLHRIKIKFITDMICLYPFHDSNFTIENEIIIAETLIIGKIPEVVFQR